MIKKIIVFKKKLLLTKSIWQKWDSILFLFKLKCVLKQNVRQLIQIINHTVRLFEILINKINTLLTREKKMQVQVSKTRFPGLILISAKKNHFNSTQKRTLMQ